MWGGITVLAKHSLHGKEALRRGRSVQVNLKAPNSKQEQEKERRHRRMKSLQCAVNKCLQDLDGYGYIMHVGWSLGFYMGGPKAFRFFHTECSCCTLCCSEVKELTELLQIASRHRWTGENVTTRAVTIQTHMLLQHVNYEVHRKTWVLFARHVGRRQLFCKNSLYLLVADHL